MAALPWNQWQLSCGMGGRLPVESVADFSGIRFLTVCCKLYLSSTNEPYQSNDSLYFALGFLIDVHVFGGTVFRGTVIWRILICGIGLLNTLYREIYELGDE